MGILKKISIGFILTALSIISCNKDHGEIQETDSSLARVIVKKELVVGINASMEPLSFYANNGKTVGFEIDIAKRIADKLGVKLRTISVNDKNNTKKLNNYEIDYIASGFTVTESHHKDFLLSDPYIRDAFVVIVPRTTATGDITVFEDLQNKKIGFLKIDLNNAIKEKIPDGNTVYYPRLMQLLVALEYGQVDAGVISLLTYYSKIIKHKKPYRILGEPIAVYNYGYGFRKKDAALRDTVNRLLYEFADDFVLKNISSAWFGMDIAMIGKY